MNSSLRTAAALALVSLAACSSSKGAQSSSKVSVSVAASTAAPVTTSADPNGPSVLLARLTPPVRGQVVAAAGATVAGMTVAQLEATYGPQANVAFAAAQIYTGGTTYGVVIERFSGSLTDMQLDELMAHDVGLPEISVSARDQAGLTTVAGRSVTTAVLQTATVAVIVIASTSIPQARAVAAAELKALAG